MINLNKKLCVWNYVCVPAEGGSGGLAILWDPSKLSYNNLSSNKHWHCGRITSILSNSNFIVIDIYGPPQTKKEREVWLEIEALLNLYYNENIILGGDFNATLLKKERWQPL